MSVVEDVEKLIWEVERRPASYKKKLKEYSDKNLRDKLWYEAYKSEWPRSNAEKTIYKVMSSDQNAGGSHNIKIYNSCFEKVENLRYLRTSLTNQNYIKEGIKCRLKSQNACYRSVQNLLSSNLLPKNIKIKVNRTTVSLLFCKGVKLDQNKKRPPGSHC